jgi:hypothetical protein
MNIYLSLFQASITLAGFIAVFLVFRYRQIDTYVDSRKDILRSLLKNEIKNNSYIEVEIQEIGKEHDHSYYEELFKENTVKENTVNVFVNHIFQYRKLRKCIVRLGLGSISAWGLLSLVFLLIHVISPCLFNNTWCSGIMVGISICLFIISMIFTLFFVCYSLCAKRPQ